MKALLLEQYNQLVYGDVPDPSIGDGDVLVKVEACGICGSDVHGMDGSSGRRIPPIIMGHEAAGTVAGVGRSVAGIHEGDRVTFDSTISCGECPPCRRGEINLCDRRMVLGVSCDEYKCDGAFAEYVVVPRRIIYPLPENLSFERAAMVEPVSIAVHAVNLSPVSLNDTAVVVGAGMIGLLVIQGLRAAGCGCVIAVDIDEARLALARKLGAAAAVNGKSGGAKDELLDITGGRGADIAVDAVGRAAAVETAAGCVRKGGHLTLIGNLDASVPMALQRVVTRQLTLRGSCASSGEYPDCLEMIARGDIDVDALMSRVAPLADGAEWFNRLHRREEGLMKVVLKPRD